MVKDVVNGEIFRADHLVEAVLESRLKGDKEARGQAAAPPAAEDDKKKKKKKVVKSTAVKLEDSVVKEYEFLLAQVRTSCTESPASFSKSVYWHSIVRLTTIPGQNWETLLKSTTLSTQKPVTSFQLRWNSI